MRSIQFSKTSLKRPFVFGSCASIFLSIALLGAHSTRADEDEPVSGPRSWIVSPINDASSAKIDALFANEKSSHPLFSSKRSIQAMGKNGFSKLAHARTLRVTDAERAKLVRRAAKQGVQLRWERDVDLKPQSLKLQAPIPTPEPFEYLQWGLSNHGGKFYSPVEYLQEEEIEGKVGEDVRVPATSSLKPIVVAVLDTGVDLEHPELASQIYIPQTDAKKRECALYDQYLACVKTKEEGSFEPDLKDCNDQYLKPENDFDGNGFILDCKGWDFGTEATEQGSPRVLDDYGHGTHVAGIIAAKRDHNGVRGIGSDFIQILPVRVLRDAAPTGPGAGKSREVPVGEAATQLASTVAKGISYAVDNGARVINLSLGWPFLQDGAGTSGDGAIHDVFRYARSRGVSIVAASGNDGTDYPILPCSYPEVLCVGSHGPDGRISSFSNYGSAIALFAPGDAILSTIRSQEFGESFNELKGYDALSGTSMASPFVAGAMAWCMAEGHGVTECEARLMASSRAPQVSPLGLWGAGGLLDLNAALSLTPRPVIIPQERGVKPVIWSGNLDEAVTISVTLVNLWQATESSVTVSADYADSLPQSVREQIDIEYSPLVVPTWGSAPITYEFKVKMKSALAPSELAFEIKLAGEGLPANGALRRIVRVEVQTRAGNNSLVGLGVPIETFQIEGNRLPLNQMGVRTVTAIDASTDRDYAISEPSAVAGQPPVVSIVRVENGKARFGADDRPTRVPVVLPTGAFVMGFYRGDVDGDRQNDYLLRYSYALPEGKAGRGSKWVKLPRPSEGEGKPNFEVVNYDQVDQAFLPSDHQWLRLANGKLTPAWVGGGTVPVNERKIIDSKKPYLERKRTRINPADGQSFYYLANDGLRTVPAPVGWSFASALPLSARDKNEGTPSALVVRGKGDDLEFRIVRVHSTPTGFAVDWIDGVRPLPRLSRYWSIATRTHELELGRTQNLAIESYDSGFGFDSIHETADGKWEISAIRRWAALSPGSTRAYLGVLATFSDHGALSEIYTLSKYDLVYRTAEKESRVSLRRFSFLPGYQFDASFYPVRTEVAGITRGAIALPPGSGVSKSLEIITPNRAGDLVRPVAGRLLPADGCKLPLDPVELESSSAFDLFCGNTIRRIHLKF